MDYRIVVTEEAEEDLNRFIQYLLFIKKNHQAAINVLDDFEDTVEMLKHVAGSLKLYRIENDVVYVDDIFHELQDYENRMI